MEMAVRTTVARPLTAASVFCLLSRSFLRAKRGVFFVVLVVVAKVGHVTLLRVPHD